MRRERAKPSKPPPLSTSFLLLAVFTVFFSQGKVSITFMSTGPKREKFKTLITVESLHSGVCPAETKYSTNAGRTGRNWYLMWWGNHL